MNQYLAQMSGEAYGMLIFVALFMALLGLMAVADDLLLWAARRREEKFLKARWARGKGGVRNA